jgi:ATP-dependent helicase/nuclease subunit A
MTPAYEHHGQPVTRERFYAIACDPRRSVAVEACAGAGKTWMLVSRIVRALLDGSAPHDILAITFTKKAAGEMRQRLNEWLVEFAQASPGQLEQELLARGISKEMDPQALLELGKTLQNLYQVLLGNGRTVQIRTFHSWFAALLRTAPLAVLQQMGLPSNYELLEDDAKAVAQVWRRFSAVVAADDSARQDYLAAVAGHGRHQTQKALEAALSKRVEFALADAQGVVDASVDSMASQFPEFAGLAHPHVLLTAHVVSRQTLLEAAGFLGRATQASFSAKGRELEQAVTESDVPGMLAALLTQDGSPRKFSDKVAGIEQVRLAQALTLRVGEALTQHQAWEHQQRMARLTRLLLVEFAQLKRERGWVDMNDVERAALVMLSDPVLSGWVQERLDARIRHLMIDEFQDTNPLQWQALSAWLSGYAGAGQAPSVFIVGDPKQSIYRFRRAEPQVFRAAQKFVVEGLGGDRLSCDHTRRNATGIVLAVNEVMGAAQSEGAYEGFRPHTTESQDRGALFSLPRIERETDENQDSSEDPRDVALDWRDSLTQPRVLPEETLKTRECRQAACWLAQQLGAQALEPRQIMVLSRKRERLSLMQEELAHLHIPSQQPEKTDLADVPEVQDMVALLDALVSPGHDLSLARALKSPLFGVSDADLVQLALLQRAQREKHGDMGNAGVPAPAWFELLQDTPALPPGLAGVASTLLRWQGWLAALPPHDALDAIYHDGDVLARFVAAAPSTQREATLANLRALLSAALALDGGRYATPYAFVRALKAGGVKAPTRADANAVRLLTIHGAKGLEAPLVLLLDADAEASKAETMGVLVDWPGEAAVPQRFIFLASETRPPSCAVQALAQEQTARQREELNALYVAMTRARQQLVVSCIAPHKPSPGSWWQRLQAWCTPIEAAAMGTETATSHETMQGLPRAVDFPLPILPPALVNSSNSATKNIAIESRGVVETLASLQGQAMHRLLEWRRPGGPFCSDEQMQAVAYELGLDDARVREAAVMAQRIVAGEGAWVWDANELAWQGNEVALMYQASLLRLDRLVQHRRSGEWWVLDYKSAAQPQLQAELLAQLKTYRAAVQAAQPGQVVRAAFLAASGAMIEITEG